MKHKIIAYCSFLWLLLIVSCSSIFKQSYNGSTYMHMADVELILYPNGKFSHIHKVCVGDFEKWGTATKKGDTLILAQLYPFDDCFTLKTLPAPSNNDSCSMQFFMENEPQPFITAHIYTADSGLVAQTDFDGIAKVKTTHIDSILFNRLPGFFEDEVLFKLPSPERAVAIYLKDKCINQIIMAPQQFIMAHDSLIPLPSNTYFTDNIYIKNYYKKKKYRAARMRAMREGYYNL